MVVSDGPARQGTQTRKTPLNPENILQWLIGAWTISREAPGLATMQGHACFLETADGAAEYHETVSVQLRNHSATLHAEQRYEYRQTETGLAVYFAPPSPEAGELFHLLEFSIHDDQLRAYAHHQCKEDLYLSEYIFPADGKADSFTVQHKVKGPSKEYSLLSHYARG